MSSDIRSYRDFAGQLADASREILGEALKRPFRGELKSDGSPVTAIDRAVEERLREMIAARFPEHLRANTPSMSPPGTAGCGA